MNILHDLFQSLYNIPYIGKELSRRKSTPVVITLLILVTLYTIAAGSLYAYMTQQLVSIIGDEVALHAVPFSITEGALSSPVDQPYIVTDRDLTPEFYASLAEWMGRTPFGRTVNFNAIAEHANNPMTDDTARDGGYFCFVLDTTGTYQEKIDEDKYLNSVVLLEDRMRYTERQGGAPRYQEQFFTEVKEDVSFYPENLETIIPVMARSLRALIWGGVFVGTLIRFIVKALFVALLAFFMMKMQKKQFPYGRIFTIAIYSLTPTVLLGIIAKRWWAFPEFLIFVVYVVYVFHAVTLEMKREVIQDLKTP